MNEIARNYNDDLTKRSFNNQQQSHMTQQVKKKNKFLINKNGVIP